MSNLECLSVEEKECMFRWVWANRPIMYDDGWADVHADRFGRECGEVVVKRHYREAKIGRDRVKILLGSPVCGIYRVVWVDWKGVFGPFCVDEAMFFVDGRGVGDMGRFVESGRYEELLGLFGLTNHFRRAQRGLLKEVRDDLVKKVLRLNGEAYKNWLEVVGSERDEFFNTDWAIKKELDSQVVGVLTLNLTPFLG